MKRWKIKWGSWDSSAAELPGKTLNDAMELFNSKYPGINPNSITCMGPW